MNNSVKILVLTVTVVLLLYHVTCTEEPSPLLGGRCRRLRPWRLLRELKKRGRGPLGAFNKNYMAITKKGTTAFPNLVQIGQLSWIRVSLPPVSSDFKRSTRGRFPMTTPSARCQTTMNGFRRACPACPAVTDLGPNIVPRFINEVLCPGGFTSCAGGRGTCKNTVLLQTFLRRRCDDDDEEETLEEFTQEIRACCDCCLF